MYTQTYTYEKFLLTIPSSISNFFLKIISSFWSILNKILLR